MSFERLYTAHDRINFPKNNTPKITHDFESKCDKNRIWDIYAIRDSIHVKKKTCFRFILNPLK